MIVRECRREDIPAVTRIWNRVIRDGRAFPQIECVKEDEAEEYFTTFDYVGVAESPEGIVGMYEIRPNNVGRCGHIGNVSYAVDPEHRGCGIGRMLVRDSFVQAKAAGYRIMQLNAVVDYNLGAIHLYESEGYVRIGTVPGGFRDIDDEYRDIHLFYRVLRSFSHASRFSILDSM